MANSNLTVNQINAVGGGSDTLTFDFSGSTYTTGGSIIAANIETVTLQTSAGGTKTVSGATFANANMAGTSMMAIEDKAQI